MIDLGVIITGVIGLVTSITSGWLSYLFTRKKYNSEVDENVIHNMKESLEFYKQLSDDNKERLNSLLKRNDVTFEAIKKYLPLSEDLTIDKISERQLEIYVKYEGYIKNQEKEAKKLHKLDDIKLNEDLDYLNFDGLALEARQKFNVIKPKTIGQASRISGVNPSDINVLIMYLRKNRLI